ncbi:MAG: FAD-binding protein, partial [Candidatus Methylomirabilis sp.]|nr:FAD-binding protein [Deltaproteobacteria bacterium]
ANGEFIQVHPTAIPGTDKCRLMSESARGEGGRVWTYKDGKPWYFLEEMYPAYGNLVPRDIATRAIFKVCTEMRLGVDGKNQVYLDLTHMDPHELDVKLGGILEIYEKFVGEDPRKYPMKIFPAVHYSMGGLWVDFDQQTSIPGVFAAGECEYQYHGANRLGANSLLSCIFGGSVAGPKAVACVQGQAKSEIASRLFDEEVARQEEVFRSIYASDGGENPYRIWREMGDLMNENVTIVRYNDKLRATDEKLLELQDRYRKITIEDKSRWSNQSALFARQLGMMLDLARVIAIGALRRDESRGAHYKPDFPDRDDARFLKTTIAKWTKTGPEFSYEEVDTQHIKPRERKYDVAKTAA